MNEKIIYVLIYLSGVMISSVSQIFLKKSAQKKYANKVKEYLNIYVIVAYTLFFAATLVTVFAFKKIPLSMGPILGASGYLFVALLSKWFFNEKITKMKMVGLSIIIVGIVVYSL